MLKKFIFLVTLILILCGCSQKKDFEEIKTVVEENKDVLIGINYPVTGNKILDQDIINYVENKYNIFKNKYRGFKLLLDKSELNIDYDYNIINDKYINVIIYAYIKSSNFINPIIEYKTFLFNKKENKYVNIKDIVSDPKKLIYDVNSKLVKLNKKANLNTTILNNFFIDNNNITLYFHEKNNYYSIILPTNDYLDVEASFNKIESYYAKSVNKIIDPSKPVLALTFDDGPSKYTKKIIDILNENDANATFFILGNKANIYSDTLNYMINSGNEIGNHSYNHKWLTKLTSEEIKDQLNKTQEIIKSITGYTPIIMRPTYGSINDNLRNSSNLQLIMWNVDSNDWKLKNSKKIANRIINSVNDGDIILMHDTYNWTMEAVKIIVPKLIKEGYQFITVSELNEIKLLRNNRQ